MNTEDRVRRGWRLFLLGTGLLFVTCRGPTHPVTPGGGLVWVGTWPFGPARAVAIDPAGGRVFLGMGSGVYVLDVSDPEAPKRIFTFFTPGKVTRVRYDASTHRLFVGTNEQRLLVYDATVSRRPFRMGGLHISRVDGSRGADREP